MIYSSTNTQPGSTEKINISAKSTTITTLPSIFLDTAELEISFKDMFSHFDSKFDKQKELMQQLSEIKHEGMVNLASLTVCLTETTKALKEKNTKFSSKLDNHIKKFTFFATSYDELPQNIGTNNRVGKTI